MQEDVSPEGLRYLEASLRLIPGDVLLRMQARGRSVFNAHFKDLPSQVNSAFALLAHRWDGVIKTLQAEMEAESSGRAQLAALASSGNGNSSSSSSSAGGGVASVVPAAASLTPPAEEGGGGMGAALPSGLGAGASAEAGAAAASPATTLSAAAPATSAAAVTANTALPAALEASLAAHSGHLSTASAAIGRAAEHLAQLRTHLTSLVTRSAIGTPSAPPLSAADVLEALSSPLAVQASSNLSLAVDHWLRWLTSAVPDPAHRTGIPAVRGTIVQILSMLTQSYGAAGEWRHAATCSHALMLHLGPERSAEAAGGDTGRLRNANADMRRRCSAREFQAQAHTTTHKQAIYRLVEEPQPPYAQLHMPSSSSSDSAAPALTSASHLVLPGYGALAHFLGPQPLGSIGTPSLAMPVDLRVASAAVGAAAPVAGGLPSTPPGAHPARYTLGESMPELLLPTLGPGSAVSHVLVTESVLKGVAARLDRGGDASAGGLPPNPHPSLSQFRARHGVPLVPPSATLPPTPPPPADPALPTSARPAATILQRTLSLGIGRVAIVSLCAYDAQRTNLTSLSSRNLNAYCDLHGYECFLGTSSMDTARPIAWTKILLTAALLPRYEWVLWRDCDTFFAAPEVTVETLLASAGVARGVIAAAVGGELGARGSLAHLQAGALAHAPTGCPFAGASAAASGAVDALPLASSTMDLVISEDGFLLNTGVWAVRNSAWGQGWLRRVYGEALGSAHVGLSPFGVDWIKGLLEDVVAAAEGSSSSSSSSALDAQAALLRSIGINVTPASAAALRAMVASANATASVVVSPDSTETQMKRTLGSMREGRVAAGMGGTLVASRMWEQGMALEHLSMRGALVRRSSAGGNASARGDGGGGEAGVEVLGCDAGMFAGGWEHGASAAPCQDSSGGAALLPWMDTLHTQFVPQAWLNAYPLPIARQLLEVGPSVPGQAQPSVTPLHAAYRPGDWCISFSGCTAYFKQADCEQLFSEGAEEAHRALLAHAARVA